MRDAFCVVYQRECQWDPVPSLVGLRHHALATRNQSLFQNQETEDIELRANEADGTRWGKMRSFRKKYDIFFLFESTSHWRVYCDDEADMKILSKRRITFDCVWPVFVGPFPVPSILIGPRWSVQDMVQASVQVLKPRWWAGTFVLVINTKWWDIFWAMLITDMTITNAMYKCVFVSIERWSEVECCCFTHKNDELRSHQETWQLQVNELEHHPS